MRSHSSAALVLTVLLLAAPAHAALRATAAFDRIAITGATPNGSVAVCRFAESYVGAVDTTFKQASVTSADAQGRLTVLAEVSTERALWLVVDFSTNDYVVASSALDLARHMRQAPVTQPNTPTVTVFDTIADVFVVRAPLGIWTGEGGDGRAGDDDGRVNGRVSFALRSLTPVGNTPPGPAVLVPGDIVFTAEPGWMTYDVLRIEKGNGNAQ